MFEVNNKDIKTTAMIDARAATRGVLWKKVFLEISQIFQLFSCETLKISNQTYFEEHLRTTASIDALCISVRDQKLYVICCFILKHTAAFTVASMD